MKVGKEQSDVFNAQRGLREGCGMSLRQFSLFMDGFMKEVNE